MTEPAVNLHAVATGHKVERPGADELVALRRTYLACAARAAELEAEMDDIKAIIANRFFADIDSSDIEVDGGKISFGYGRRFDMQTALENLPGPTIELCYERTITAARAKQVLAPSLYALCQKRNDKPTVKVQ